MLNLYQLIFLFWRCVKIFLILYQENILNNRNQLGLLLINKVALAIELTMINITIQNFDDDLKNRLQKRAESYGRSLEEEAREILRAVLTENTPEPLNLAVAIERRFAHFSDFELPTIHREPLREPPNFEDLYDCT
ncbi:FitA-like ribbon-helix-helix domain-containing protein [Planktothrix mougeotii]|nr:hypothetical protein [Planktothrix mougeotii]